jgi:hypothetical protein
MDVSFWQAIVDADFAVPIGLTVSDLTPQLVDLLGSTNSHLRDDFGFTILAVWIDRGGYYSPDQLRELGAQLAHNLSIGIGETETDSVFQRAFSALILGKVIDADNRETFLSATAVHRWLDQALTYVHAERDVRGFVPGKGWAHAVAHMGTRMSKPVPYVYRALEDERMAYAVMVALQRELLTPAFLMSWVDRLAHRWSGERWSTVSKSGENANAYNNTRQFLRSLYFQLLLGIRAPFWYTDPTPFGHIPSVRDALLNQIVAGLRVADVGFYADASE